MGEAGRGGGEEGRAAGKNMEFNGNNNKNKRT